MIHFFAAGQWSLLLSPSSVSSPPFLESVGDYSQLRFAIIAPVPGAWLAQSSNDDHANRLSLEFTQTSYNIPNFSHK